MVEGKRGEEEEAMMGRKLVAISPSGVCDLQCLGNSQKEVGC